jgi:hypothetical protein
MEYTQLDRIPVTYRKDAARYVETETLGCTQLDFRLSESTGKLF